MPSLPLCILLYYILLYYTTVQQHGIWSVLVQGQIALSLVCTEEQVLCLACCLSQYIQGKIPFPWCVYNIIY